MNRINHTKLVETVSAAAKEVEGRKRMPCAEALRLAAELGVQPGAIGRICHERNIKIVACQLGCFR